MKKEMEFKNLVSMTKEAHEHLHDQNLKNTLGELRVMTYKDNEEGEED